MKKVKTGEYSMSDSVKNNSKTFRKNKIGGDTSSDMYSPHEPVQAQPLEVKVYGNGFDKDNVLQNYGSIPDSIIYVLEVIRFTEV